MEARAAYIKFHGELVGILSKSEGEYEFKYQSEYLSKQNAVPVAYTLPLRSRPYKSRTLFPFFEGLATEGWLRDIQSRKGKIDSKDAFSLLLRNGSDLVGAVTIEEINDVR